MRRLSRIQRFGWFVVAVMSFVCLWSPAGLGSVRVYPARMELEVPTSGAVTQLTIENRGPEPVRVRLSSGMGTHTVEGTPIYFDDTSAVNESSRWVVFDTDELIIPAGQREVATVSFRPVQGAVSAYPMIFAELYPKEDDTRTAASTVMVPRVAIPVLLTFEDSKDQRVVSTETVAMSLRSVVDELLEESLVEVSVVLRNTGNVHDLVSGRIEWLAPTGVINDVTTFKAHTILPGAERVFRTYWDPEERALDDIRLVATFYGDGWTGPSRPASFYLQDGEFAVAAVGTLSHASVDLIDLETDEER